MRTRELRVHVCRIVYSLSLSLTLSLPPSLPCFPSFLPLLPLHSLCWEPRSLMDSDTFQRSHLHSAWFHSHCLLQGSLSGGSSLSLLSHQLYWWERPDIILKKLWFLLAISCTPYLVHEYLWFREGTAHCGLQVTNIGSDICCRSVQGKPQAVLRDFLGWSGFSWNSAERQEGEGRWKVWLCRDGSLVNIVIIALGLLAG